MHANCNLGDGALEGGARISHLGNDSDGLDDVEQQWLRQLGVLEEREERGRRAGATGGLLALGGDADAARVSIGSRISQHTP